jgi:hypothetical protein
MDWLDPSDEDQAEEGGECYRRKIVQCESALMTGEEDAVEWRMEVAGPAMAREMGIGMTRWTTGGGGKGAARSLARRRSKSVGGGSRASDR